MLLSQEPAKRVSSLGERAKDVNGAVGLVGPRYRWEVLPVWIESLSMSIVSHARHSTPFSNRSLTYFKHQPPHRPCALGHVDCSSILGIGNQSENFGGKTDRVAVVVFGFEGFAVGFG